MNADSDANDPMPQPPEPLPDDACCGNGCDPCVFDFFYAEQAAHRAALKAWCERQAGRQSGAGLTGPSSPA